MKQLFLFLDFEWFRCVTIRKGSKMNRVGFSSNYGAANVTSYNSTPAFKGALGDKFVSKLAKGETVEVKEVMDAVKGTFGPKSEKVADVFESLLGRVQVLTSNNEANLRGRQIAESKLAEVPKQIQDAELKTRAELSEAFQTVLNEKNAELAAKDVELKAAKEYAAKYEPMSSVKSIEEIGVVMPEQVIETLKEMVEHKAEAADSMFNFLMTGKGQEAAVAQIERHNVFARAFHDGVVNIPEVNEAMDKIRYNNDLYVSSEPLSFTIDLIEKALRGNPKGSYLESYAIRNQVKANAMGFLTPMCNNKYSNMSEEATSKHLDESFNSIIKFNKNLKKGKEKYIKQYSDAVITENVVPYDMSKSGITVKLNDSTWDVSNYQLANFGSY